VYGVGEFRLGESWHVPVPADYDGDGRVEPASWSTLTHRWFVWGRPPTRFGADGDVPVPAFYDADNRADLAVWHPPAADGTGRWDILGVGSFGVGHFGEVPAPLG
jgi:hypothetical protein